MVRKGSRVADEVVRRRFSTNRAVDCFFRVVEEREPIRDESVSRSKAKESVTSCVPVRSPLFEVELRQCLVDVEVPRCSSHRNMK